MFLIVIVSISVQLGENEYPRRLSCLKVQLHKLDEMLGDMHTRWVLNVERSQSFSRFIGQKEQLDCHFRK